MFAWAFANAVLWKTRMYAKVIYISQMRYLEDDMCLLSLRDFTVVDFSGHEQQYRSLRCHETFFSRGGEFITLSFPQSMISHCVTPLSPDSSLSCTIVLQTSHQLLNDLHRLFKVFQVHTQFPEDLLQDPSLLLSTSMQHFQGEISVLICCSV